MRSLRMPIDMSVRQSAMSSIPCDLGARGESFVDIVVLQIIKPLDARPSVKAMASFYDDFMFCQ